MKKIRIILALLILYLIAGTIAIGAWICVGLHSFFGTSFKP